MHFLCIISENNRWDLQNTVGENTVLLQHIIIGAEFSLMDV